AGPNRQRQGADPAPAGDPQAAPEPGLDRALRRRQCAMRTDQQLQGSLRESAGAAPRAADRHAAPLGQRPGRSEPDALLGYAGGIPSGTTTPRAAHPRPPPAEVPSRLLGLGDEELDRLAARKIT